MYLFEFVNKATEVSYTCISTDLATEAQKVRINLFSITEGVDDRLNGSLVLGNIGQYYYIVYEQESATNLDPDLATGIVERGLMRLIDSTDNETGYVEYHYDIDYVEYE